MLIRNNTLRIVVVPVKGGNVRIMPGVQEIEAKSWKEIQPLVKEKIEEGDLENMDERMDDEFEEGLGAFSVNEAKKLVKETADEALLDEWLAGEKRKGVKDAIKKQKEYIANAVKEGDDADEE
jgi:hypothetical protein